MEFQIDTRETGTEEVRVGVNDQEIARFQKAGFFIYNLECTIDGLGYQLKLPAPWNGFRYRLRGDERELAIARRKRRMHAFEPDRPLVRHNLVEFELSVGGQSLLLIPEDRHGSSYILSEDEAETGRLVMRAFRAQEGGNWQADLEAPDGWTVPLAAFVAWLAREGRSGMGS